MREKRVFAEGREVPEDRRCLAVVVRGAREGQVCGGWTAKDSDGQYMPFCSGHAGVPQREWQRLSEERKLEKRLALDAKKAAEAAARDRLEQAHEEAEEKAEIEREILRRRQREREEQQLVKLQEEHARNFPPDHPVPGPGHVWTKRRCETAKGDHLDEHGSFTWTIVPTLQVLRQEVDALLVDGFHQREALMKSNLSSRRQLIGELNARQRRRRADRDALHRW